MKRILILFAIFCSVISAKAQVGLGGGGSSIVGRISGSVIDSVTKETMPYTTVALFRNTGTSPLNGVLTDDKGVFKIDGVKPGTYRIEITFVGYPTKKITNIVTTLSKPDKALGTVFVSPSAKTLKDVEVTGVKALVE